MNPGVLFLIGLVGCSAVVVVVTGIARGVREKDTCAPASRYARKRGCTCVRMRNWFGWREAVTGRAVLARGCPVISHHPVMRTRMFKK